MGTPALQSQSPYARFKLRHYRRRRRQPCERRPRGTQLGNRWATEYNQIRYGRTHTVDRDGQGGGLSGEVESKDFGLGARPVAETIRPERAGRLRHRRRRGSVSISPELALVQTVDFFTPIVDDPYTFGQIAAANSLSDVYAMGGRPISALSIVGFPNAGRDVEILEQILQGGLAKMQEAGCTVIGGHSIGDEEIKFGYAVTGVINPQRVLKNVGAQPGDRLILTKRLGTGVIATALKKDAAAKARWMRRSFPCARSTAPAWRSPYRLKCTPPRTSRASACSATRGKWRWAAK